MCTEPIDQLEGAPRKAVPDLPDDAKTVVLKVIASARNEWIRSTTSLVTEAEDAMEPADETEDVNDPA